MKKLFLSAVLLCTVASDCLALNEKEATAVAAGIGAAVGLWSWWGHVSNKNAIKRAESLWDECGACIGKQERYVTEDLDATISALGMCPILKRQFDIDGAHKALARKMDWFWNRSDRMRQAFYNIKELKKSLDDYKRVFNQAKLQKLICSVSYMWRMSSSYDLSYDPSAHVIKGATLETLCTHPLLKSHGYINALYHDLVNSQPYSYEHIDAIEKIKALKAACDRWVDVCNQIRRYDDIVEQYQDFIAHMLEVRSKQDLIADARKNSSGQYPLLDFVEKINADIKKLSMMKLHFAYVKVANKVIAIDNALSRVEQHLIMISSIVAGSHWYQDELNCYHEKLRMLEEQRRLAEEQRRLHANVNKMNQEIESLKYDNWRLAQELKNKQNK